MLKLKPACKDYLWGGDKLRTAFGVESDLHPLAEAWVLSCHPDGPSVIVGGKDDGKTLAAYLTEHGKEVLGEDCRKFEDFPILTKLIDAKGNLSIQVHPSNEYALEHEHQYGKTEMWYVMDCDEGAFLYFGVNRPVTKEEFRQRIADNTVLEVLNKVDVHPGDVFFIQSGTIHAIGAGILICEIQQTSNVTYRLYDYGRLGADGKPRALHVEKALDVLDYHRKSVGRSGGNGPYRIGAPSENTLAATEWFTVTKFDMRDGEILPARGDAPAFRALLVVDGAGEVIGSDGPERLTAGSSRLLRQSAPISFCGRLSVLVVDF